MIIYKFIEITGSFYKSKLVGAEPPIGDNKVITRKIVMVLIQVVSSHDHIVLAWAFLGFVWVYQYFVGKIDNRMLRNIIVVQFAPVPADSFRQLGR